MELAGTLDLSGTTDPQLVYWIRGAVGDNGGFQAQVSIDGGASWSTVWSFGQYWSGDWTRVQVSLAAYRQSEVRLRFRASQSTYTGWSDIVLDDIAIEEMPEPVNLHALVPHLKSVDLTWDASTLPDFDRYEVYRSTSANVTVGDTLIYSSTDSGDTAFIDTGLSIGATYFYRVFVFNSRSAATPSNERTTTTVPLSFPFADSMENLDSWDATGTWGPDGTDPYEGSFSLNDSPGDNSTPSQHSYILTAIDLSGSSWPVLRFFDRYGLVDDWAAVEVSTNGTSWTKVYSAYGTRLAWTGQAIDLSPWKTETNLRIRFSVWTNSANFDEGWYVDALSIGEHLDVGVTLPFADDLESGMGNWLISSWAPWVDNPHGGAVAVRSTPNGAIVDRSELSMELAGTLDLSGTTDPQLVYWIRGAVGDNGGFQAQVSIDGGASWSRYLLQPTVKAECGCASEPPRASTPG
jgi:hypothetical protein